MRRIRSRSTEASGAATAAPMTLASPPAAVAVEITATAAWLTDREFRSLPVGRLSLGAWQRRPNEPPMHRAFVLASVGIRLGFRSGFRLLDDGLFLNRGSFNGLFLAECFRENGFFRANFDRQLFLAAWRRDTRLLVFVVCVAGRAARLLHLIINHRDDCVIGNAAFTRTIVVQNVTEPKPALLH